MSSISDIQEYIDQHKAEMPTEIVRELLKKCQKAYESEPEFYKVMVTEINTYVKAEHKCSNGCCDDITHETVMKHRQQELLLEKRDDHAYDVDAITHYDKLGMTFLPARWLDRQHDRQMPIIMYPNIRNNRKDTMVIITSIEPYRKRPRDEEE